MGKRILLSVVAVLIAASGYWAGAGHRLTPDTAVAADECQTFSETGKSVCGRFLAYWRANGGLAQQGLPLSDEMDERSDVDGKTYKMQYFERAIFEYHPENKPPYDVLLSLLGREKLQQRYPAGLPSGEVPLQVGQTLVIDPDYSPSLFQVVIQDIRESATWKPGYRSTPATAQGKFVIVTFRITNVGDQPSMLTGGNLTLKDQLVQDQGTFLRMVSLNLANVRGPRKLLAHESP